MTPDKTPTQHIATRRAALLAAACVGVSPQLLAERMVARLTFEQLIGSARGIVIAKIHRFMFSEMGGLDDFKPAAEVKSRELVVFDITIERVLAIDPKWIERTPVAGSAFIFLGAGSTDDRLSITPYPAAIGQEVLLLLDRRRPSTSKDTNQAPIYYKINGVSPSDQIPIPLDRLTEVLAAAFNAGLIQPSLTKQP